MSHRRADWLGWSLQFIFGFMVGVILGFFLISRRRHPGWLVNGEVVHHFILGAGLLSAAVASHFGDQLWVDYRVIPPDVPDQSRFSILLSVMAGVSGVGLMAFAVLRTMGTL